MPTAVCAALLASCLAANAAEPATPTSFPSRPATSIAQPGAYLADTTRLRLELEQIAAGHQGVAGIGVPSTTLRTGSSPASRNTSFITTTPAYLQYK